MSDLQKLVENGGWLPIEECPSDIEVLLYCPELGVTNHERIEVGVYHNSRGGRRHAWATKWMPLDTPEKLAKIAGVLVEYMRKIEYVYDDGAHELVKAALQQAEQIAGGGNV